MIAGVLAWAISSGLRRGTPTERFSRVVVVVAPAAFSGLFCRQIALLVMRSPVTQRSYSSVYFQRCHGHIAALNFK
ncbi:MAG: hypothetical protein ACR2FS_08325 [Phormidesmis sp.]